MDADVDGDAFWLGSEIMPLVGASGNSWRNEMRF